MSSEYDAIVVGAGPNGLVAGIELARRGWKTLLLEGSSTLGGGTRTQELTLPGFRHDVCSAVHPMGVASPILRELNLPHYGVKWIHPELPLAHPLDRRRAVALHRSVDATAEGLGMDAARYRGFFSYLTAHADDLFSDMLAPARLPRHPWTMTRFGIGAGWPASLFARYFQTEEARALFAGNAAHSILPLERLLTSAIGLALQVCGHAVGWPIPEGGSQSIADALARLFEELGGRIECGRMVRTLEELPSSKAVLLDLAPRNAARLCGEALPAKYRGKLEAFRHGPGVFKVDYALREPIPWENPLCRKAGTVHVGGSFPEIAAAERTVWQGRHAERPFVLVAQPTVADPSRAPAGKHVAWAYCHVPPGSTESQEDTIAAHIERFAPGFRDCILATHTLNAAQMEAYNPNYLGGDVIGGVTDLGQLYTRPAGLFHPHATPNPRLFLCSASTPPGGGVHGMCGYWAAQEVLRKWPQ